MAIDKAIKILTSKANEVWNDDDAEAIQLGIEALKLYKELRGTKLIGEHYRLRGETEED